MYSYSLDEEHFVGKFELEENAVLTAFNDNPDIATVWVGKIVPASSYLDKVSYIGDDVVERLDDALHDYIGAEDEILGLSKDGIDNLNKLIIDYIKTNGQFNFWGISMICSYERKDFQHLLGV